MEAAIGARARMIRRRRGLGLDTVAGLMGISKSYLSRLESGQRSFVKRGLIESLAEVLGCAPADLTGTPDIAPDRRALVAASAIPALTAALHDTTLDDVPDVAARPTATLVASARAALEDADEVRYDRVANDRLGDLLIELHVAAATRTGKERRAALAAIVDVCIVARSLSATLGHGEVAVAATRRGWDAARRAERPDLAGLMAMGRGISLNRVGARRRAATVLAEELHILADEPGPTVGDTRSAQATGMVHLAAAQIAAKTGRSSDADIHLAEAGALARFTGEQNHMSYHFGPTNVAAWELSIAVESERGPEVAERVEQRDTDWSVLTSAERLAAVHFDLARAYAQDADGTRDAAALRHLDTADRVAPLRIRHDPVARELVSALDRRARRKAWELDSLKRRMGVVA